MHSPLTFFLSCRPIWFETTTVVVKNKRNMQAQSSDNESNIPAVSPDCNRRKLPLINKKLYC